MAKNVLVTFSLSKEMIDAGKYLIERLDATNSEVKSVFWSFIAEENSWELCIASKLVENEGPKKFYKRIMDINQEFEPLNQETISINNIKVLNLNNSMVKLLAICVQTDNTISDIRFTRNTINGIYIEDVYIYRSNL